LEILAFPCSQFGNNELDSHEKILAYLKENYPEAAEKFHFFEIADVNGENARPVYEMVKMDMPAEEGGMSDIGWNFDILIVDQNGKPRKRFESSKEPYKKVKSFLKRLF